jgi:thiamine biosynthesis lipoprotein
MVGGMSTAALAPRHVRAEPVMGTVVSLDVRGAPAEVARTACARVIDRLHDVDRRFSPYRPDSEVSRIDAG